MLKTQMVAVIPPSKQQANHLANQLQTYYALRTRYIQCPLIHLRTARRAAPAVPQDLHCIAVTID